MQTPSSIKAPFVLWAAERVSGGYGGELSSGSFIDAAQQDQSAGSA